MFCPKCGSENDDENIYCCKCGERLSQENNGEDEIKSCKSNIIKNKVNKVLDNIANNNKKMVIWIIVMLGIFILNIGIYVHKNNKEINAFEDAFSNAKYEQAQKIYTDVLNGSDKDKQDKFNIKLNKYLEKVISKSEKNFISDKDKKECSKELKALDEIYYYKVSSDKINKCKDTIKNYSKSREGFSRGIKLLDSKDYFNAVEQFKNVIKEDDNYDEAQKKIKHILPKAKEQKLKEAEKYFNNKNYDKAVEKINALIKYFPKDKIVEQKKNIYEQERNKYNKAKMEQKEKKKKSLLSSTTKYVDKVTKDTMYVPKPYKNLIDIGNGQVIFYPYLRGELGNDMLKLIVGFNQEDWIFMDKITCNADGDIFELDFDPFDRKSDVGWGTGIHEWVEIPVLEDSALKDYNTNPNMINNLKKLGNAKKALIKFRGDTRSRDYELTNNEKKTILNIIELHEISRGV